MERRSLLKIFAGVPAATTIIRHVPSIQAQEVVRGETEIKSPLGEPYHATGPLEMHLELLAMRAALTIERAATLPKRVHKLGHIVMPRDTALIGLTDFEPPWHDLLPKVEFGAGRQDVLRVNYTNHIEASFVVPDPTLSLYRTEIMDTYMLPACMGLADALNRFAGDKSGRRLLAFGKLPMPVDGCGALGRMGESKKVRVRALLSFHPKSLSQIFTLDMLFGTV